MASHHQHQSTAGAFSAFSLSFASPFRLCANSQNSMTFKLPCFYGFLNSAFNLKSRRQRHITPINPYLFNSDSMKNYSITISQHLNSSGQATQLDFISKFQPPLVSSRIPPFCVDTFLVSIFILHW